MLEFFVFDPDDQQSWNQAAALLREMYSEMESMGLLLPISPGGDLKWKESARMGLGRFGIVAGVRDRDLLAGFAQGGLKFLPDYLGSKAVGVIQHIFIREEYRKADIGKRLVMMLEDWFKGKKVHSVELQVIANNHEAAAFWEKMGFVPELSQYRKILQQG